MKRTFLLTILICIFFTQVVLAQSEKEKIQQIEIQKQIDKQRKLNVKLDSAVRLLEEGQYEEADKKFTIVLKRG